MTDSQQGSWFCVAGNPWFLYSADSQHQYRSEYIWPEIDGIAMFEQVIQPGMESIFSHLEVLAIPTLAV